MLDAVEVVISTSSFSHGAMSVSPLRNRRSSAESGQGILWAGRESEEGEQEISTSISIDRGGESAGSSWGEEVGIKREGGGGRGFLRIEDGVMMFVSLVIFVFFELFFF